MTEKNSGAAFNAQNFADQKVVELAKQIGNKRVLLALSGGVDSAVCAALLHKAIGKNLVCVFVDTGLMRKNEPQEIERAFKAERGYNLICVNAEAHFLKCLAGVSDPEKKRKIIGAEFITVFDTEAKKLGKIEFLAQGTIYPDISESGAEGHKLVKSHHNVGGMPKDLPFEGVIEPLRDLYKDEVRQVGQYLGLPQEIVFRQPFPGPGLGVRVLGEVTKEKLDTLREADYIFRDEIKTAGLDKKIWQYFAILPPIMSTGIEGGARTFKFAIILRAVMSQNAVSADVAHVPFEVLARAAARITSEVKSVNRVAYDITPKPPATIEWE